MSENGDTNSIHLSPENISPPIELSKKLSTESTTQTLKSDSTFKLPDGSSGNYNSTKFYLKNYRQVLSLLPAWFQFLAVGLITFKVQYTPVAIMYSKWEAYTFQSVFYIGIIIGVIPTAFLLKKIRKLFLYYMSSLACISSCIIFFGETKLSPYHIVGSFLTGLTFGIVLLTFLAHSGEISIKYLRGFNVGIIVIILDVGIYIGAIIQCKGYNNKIDDFEITGIFLFICGLMTLIISYFVCVESPIFYWDNERLLESKQSLIILRNEIFETDQIKNELNDVRATILCQPAIFSLIKKEDLLPFIKIFLFRFGYILGTALPINLKLIKLFKIYFRNDEAEWHLIFLPKILINFLIVLNIEIVGRRTFLLLSYILSGLTLITIEIILIIFNTTTKFDEMESFITSLPPISSTFVFTILFILSIMYQSFLGLGCGTVSYIYMVEGFPFGRKNFLNAFMIIVESITYIVIVVSINGNDDIQNLFVLVTGLLQLWIAGIAITFAPETKKMVLLDTQYIFRSKK